MTPYALLPSLHTSMTPRVRPICRYARNTRAVGARVGGTNRGEGGRFDRTDARKGMQGDPARFLEPGPGAVKSASYVVTNIGAPCVASSASASATASSASCAKSSASLLA